MSEDKQEKNLIIPLRHKEIYGFLALSMLLMDAFIVNLAQSTLLQTNGITVSVIIIYLVVIFIFLALSFIAVSILEIFWSIHRIGVSFAESKKLMNVDLVQSLLWMTLLIGGIFFTINYLLIT